MSFRGKSVGAFCAVLLSGGALLAGAAPASAASFSGPYVNHVTHLTEGTYIYVDSPTTTDGGLSVSNVANGYSVQVRFLTRGLNGVWTTRLLQTVPDGLSRSFQTADPTAGSRVRVELCTLDSAGVQRGACTVRETTNNY